MGKQRIAEADRTETGQGVGDRAENEKGSSVNEEPDHYYPGFPFREILAVLVHHQGLEP